MEFMLPVRSFSQSYFKIVFVRSIVGILSTIHGVVPVFCVQLCTVRNVSETDFPPHASRRKRRGAYLTNAGSIEASGPSRGGSSGGGSPGGGPHEGGFPFPPPYPQIPTAIPIHKPPPHRTQQS